MSDIYSFTVKKSNGDDFSLSDLRGKTVLIVNTATKCGFAPQFKGLEALYQDYRDRGLVVLGFPCNQFANQEPVDDSDMQQVCELNFGVTFPLMGKVDVNGSDASPLFEYLKTELPGVLGSKKVKWNFTKFLIDSEGHPVKRYAPKTSPNEIRSDIEKLL
jgi:glutathione peroxidase